MQQSLYSLTFFHGTKDKFTFPQHFDNHGRAVSFFKKGGGHRPSVLCLLFNVSFTCKWNTILQSNFYSVYTAHYRHITGTLQAHYRHITGTLQTHYRHITGTLQAHYRHITGTLQAHFCKQIQSSFFFYFFTEAIPFCDNTSVYISRQTQQ